MTEEAGTTTIEETLPVVSPRRMAWMRFVSHKGAVVSVVVLVVLVGFALLSPLTARYGVNQAVKPPPNYFIPPSSIAWFGTADIGRNLYSRLIYGIRVSLTIGLFFAMFSVSIGCLIGATAGFRGGRFDDVVMRITDLFLAFPFLVTLLVMRSVLRAVAWLKPIVGEPSSVRFIIFLFAVFCWMGVARIVRAQVLSLKEREFVEAARAAGAGTRHVIVLHLLPNSIGPIMVALTLTTPLGVLRAVRGVDISVEEVDTLGIVGTKSSELRRIRGRDIAMTFHDPLSSLNSVVRIGAQIVEMIRAHQSVSRAEAWSKAVELLDLAGIPQPETRARQYPHEFSGGMRQRVVIAMAIANSSKVLIASEPTTALDVTVQAQILEVVQRIQATLGTALVLITHDLGVVARVCRRVDVMYAGRVVERGPVDDIFDSSTHPYTRGLLASLPREGLKRLLPIPGFPPNMPAPPSGCAFRPRCESASDGVGAS